MVTADSRIVRASKDENPDLFWALRGGGGNFGVVTSFEFALHPVGPMVNLGLFFFGLENGPEALRFARDFIKTLPAEATAFLAIGLSAPPAPFVPEQYRFRPGHALLVVGFGSAEEHAAIVAPIRKAVTPLFELVTPIPFVALQQMFNESAAWGTLGYEKALYLDELSDAAIAVIGEHVPKKSSPLSFCPTFTLAGAYRTPGDADTAFGGSRSAGYVFNIEGGRPRSRGVRSRSDVGAQLLGRDAAARDGVGWLRELHGRRPTRTVCAPRTARTSTSASRASRPNTTPRTSFTSTPTSNRRRGPPDMNWPIPRQRRGLAALTCGPLIIGRGEVIQTLAPLHPMQANKAWSD